MKTTPVVILCGGQGIWIDSSGKRKSKALVEVGGQPILYWLLGLYLRAGFNRFILSTGYQSDEFHTLFVSRYGAKKLSNQADAQIKGAASYQATIHSTLCQIDIVNTGISTSTGDRIKQVEPLLGSGNSFAVTYSDTLCAVPIQELYQYHCDLGKTATLIATHAPTRFRILGFKPTDPLVRGFASKPIIQQNRVNGGFYFFEKSILSSNYLGAGPNQILEEAILEKLAQNSQLAAFPYDGSWCYLDCERDLKTLAQFIETEFPSKSTLK